MYIRSQCCSTLYMYNIVHVYTHTLHDIVCVTRMLHGLKACYEAHRVRDYDNTSVVCASIDRATGY